ncbi:MAG: endolytic transglycosylase MltG [Candidatus Poribacteria bacterium]|nr:endolytic transglycosylase MltG [Candidatus Poribacteria bacterium]
MSRAPSFKILSRTRKIHVGILTLCCLSVLCFIALLIGVSLTRPPTSSEEVVNFDVPVGSSSRTIAKRLIEQKLIRSEHVFRLAVRYRGTGKRLQAGTYVLQRNMALWDLLDEFEKGQVTLVSWTVPEGLTTTTIAELWETSGFGTAAAFRKASESQHLLDRYGLTDKTVEGYLFPNTYKFAKGTTTETVVEMMLDEFKQQWTEKFEEEAQNLGRTRHEIVTLASVIEKEAQSDSERPRISSVFHNRLTRKWKLQADPTVLYALGNPKSPLTKADLQVESPYNTYKYKGLPPGPIANPGIDSIVAALRPEKTAYLYFVAIGEGKHHFSKTLSEHNRMIRKMRRASRKHVPQ